MGNLNSCENGYMSDDIGEKLRPGVFKLTQKAIELCNITSKDKVLDLGCGMGATISFLYNKYKIKAVGIDDSENMINIAKANCKFADFVKGSGDVLPFKDDSFDCVIAESSLSFVNNLNATIQEVNRVLKKKGWFVVTDIYLKNSSTLRESNGHSFNSCVRGLHNLDELEQKMESIGFKSVYLGEYSDLLKDVPGNIKGFKDIFESKTRDNNTCNTENRFQEKLMNFKLGYYILIALKEE